MDIITYALSKKYTDKISKTFAGGLKYQGSKSTVADLPAASASNKGHLYTITENGHEYVSDGSQWVDLGADLNNKQDKLIAGENITIAADGKTISASGGSNPECISLSFYDDGDVGTLTDEQAQILLASELNYIWLNGMHRLDFRYRDDNNNKATYSAVDTSSDGNKTHSVEINLTTKAFTVYHRTLQELISDLATIRYGAALGATAIQQHQDISGKQDKLTAGTGIKLEDNTISADVITYKAFPSSWPHTYGTTIAQFCAAVNASYKAGEIAIGDAFLGNINSPAFFNGAYIEGGGSLGSAEVSVQIMTPFGQNCVQLLTTTSSNNAPYHWEYTYVDGAVSEGWRCWSQHSYVNDKLSLKQDTLTAGSRIDITDNTINVKDDLTVNSLTSLNEIHGNSQNSETLFNVGPVYDSGSISSDKKNAIYGKGLICLNLKEGKELKSVGENVVIVGTNCYAREQSSVACGTNTEATASYSFASGRGTKASRQCTFSGGEGTVADRDHEFVIGKYNVTDTDYQLFVVGNGSSENVRSNAMTVYETGNTEIAGKLTIAGGIDYKDAAGASVGGLKFVTLTRAEYDAMATHDANTMYILKKVS